jgi:E3 ubiquitin-protein ligase TRIP12
MPPRVTRSAARLSAGSANASLPQPPALPPPAPPAPTRKRKAPARDPTPEPPPDNTPAQPTTRARQKRARVEPSDPTPPPAAPAPAIPSRLRKGKGKSAMSTGAYVATHQDPLASANIRRPPPEPSEENSAPQGPSSSARRGKPKGRKEAQGAILSRCHLHIFANTCQIHSSQPPHPLLDEPLRSQPPRPIMMFR